MMTTKQFSGAVLIAVMLFASGCAQIPPDAGSNPQDPWEKMNRQTFAFNTALDNTVMRPVAKGYQYVMPEPARKGVSNALDNLREPSNFVNNLLQGKVDDAIVSFFRFAVNSTFGLAGLFDVATMAGMMPKEEDFGQTLAVWGVGNGPYLVVPFLGPSSTRDVWRWPASTALHPMTYALYDEPVAAWSFVALDVLDLRYRALPLDDMLNAAVDPYVAVREAYLSYRLNATYDGNVPSAPLIPLDFGDDSDSDSSHP